MENPKHRQGATLNIKLFPKAGWHALILLSIEFVLYSICFFYCFIRYWEYVSIYGQIAAIQKFGLILAIGLLSLPLTFIYIYLIWNKSKYDLFINRNGLYLTKDKTIFIPWGRVKGLSIRQIQILFTFIRISDNCVFEVDLGNKKQIQFVAKGKLQQSTINQIRDITKLAKEGINN